ncbi:hypothetical protein LTR46_012101, partial [Exophiala xenobiotica]
GKSKVAASVYELPVVSRLLDSFLTHRYTLKREEIDNEVAIPPQLSLSCSLYLTPGPPRAPLHRDDLIHGIDHSIPFDLNKQTELAILVAGAKTNRVTGATLFIPGSHKWDDKRTPKPNEITFAEMDTGSAFLYLGSSYHASGQNSVPDSMRKLHGLYFIKGTLRPEENQFLAAPWKVALTMSDRLLSLLGYKQPPVPLGIVDDGNVSRNMRSVL